LRVIIRIETRNPKGVEVYLREILNQISKNKHFSITRYEIEVSESR